MLHAFLSGATMLASLVAGLFFLRFWRKTRDRLFLMFAIAFFAMGVNRVGVAFGDTQPESQTLTFYLIRLIAFLIILIAIIDKNRAANRG